MLKISAWYGLLSLALVACGPSQNVDRQSVKSFDQPADASLEAMREEMSGLTMPQRIAVTCAISENSVGTFDCDIDEEERIIRASTDQSSEPMAEVFCSMMADVKSDDDTWRLVVTGADDQHECQF